MTATDELERTEEAEMKLKKIQVKTLPDGRKEYYNPNDGKRWAVDPKKAGNEQPVRCVKL